MEIRYMSRKVNLDEREVREFFDAIETGVNKFMTGYIADHDVCDMYQSVFRCGFRINDYIVHLRAFVDHSDNYVVYIRAEHKDKQPVEYIIRSPDAFTSRYIMTRIFWSLYKNKPYGDD